MQSKVIDYINVNFPDITLKKGNTYKWNPEQRFVEYVDSDSAEIEPALLVLHEVGHAKLEHEHFSSDIDLLKKEVEAWDFAQQLAKQIKLAFDLDLAENCLDTYRHWIDKRSTCPACDFTGYQDGYSFYNCLNCRSQWKVSDSQASRICRVTVRRTI